MLEKLNAKEIKDLVVMVLSAYHTREQDRLRQMLEAANETNQWEDQWEDFLHASKSPEEALAYFTQYIQAQLDGGECYVPS